MRYRRRILKTIDEVSEWLKTFDNREFSWDTETTSLMQDRLEITGMSLANRDEGVYIVIDSSKNTNNVQSVNPQRLFKLFNDRLLFSNSLNIAHNWVFDARVVNKYGLSLFGTRVFDTMVAHHLIDENSMHGLKYLVENHLGLPVVKYDEVGEDHYTEEFYNYGLDDAVNTWILYEELKQELRRKELDYLFYKIEMPYQNVLLEMALEGVTIDTELVSKYSKELTKEINESLYHMCTIADIKYDVMDDLEGTIAPYYEEMTDYKRKENYLKKYPFKFSTQNLIKIFQKMSIPIKAKTKKGTPSIGKETLNALIRTDEEGEYVYDHEFIKYLHKYKVVSQLYNLFFKKIPEFVQKDGKIRPNFKDTGTVTGRLSSSKFNVQQLAKPTSLTKVNVREVFIAPKGYKMFSLDYSGQEICVAAQLSKDETLVKSLNRGYDMHLTVANNTFKLGIPEEALSSTHPDYKSYKEKYGKKRSMAKSVTFGLLYGKTNVSFAKDFGITEDEAQKMIDDYYKGMPGVKDAIEKTHQELSTNGYVRSMTGRYRHFLKNWRDEYDAKAYRQSFNFKIQSSSADMIRGASINVFKRKKKHPEWGLKQIMTVHDENVYIVKEQYVEEATAMAKKAFEDVGDKFIVPIKADVEWGDNYGTAK